MLNEDISSLNEILSKYGENNWKLSQVYNRHSASKTLQMFGYMGSINDLYICQLNGHKIEQHEEIGVNNKIHTLLRLIHTQCVALICVS